MATQVVLMCVVVYVLLSFVAWVRRTFGLYKSCCSRGNFHCSPVSQSAAVGVVRSGVGAPGGGGGCGSCDGGCVPGGGGDGRGAGRHGAGPAGAGAGAGVSACGGGDRLAPAAMTSSPSCAPWSSCCRWRWHPGGVQVQPSASVETNAQCLTSFTMREESWYVSHLSVCG